MSRTLFRVFFCGYLSYVVLGQHVFAQTTAADASSEPSAKTAHEKTDPVSTAGRIDEVTVYRNQALVTRIIEVPSSQGLREIVVTELPEQVVPDSIFAESSSDKIEVRSVRYRIRPVLQDVREEVRQLDIKLVDVGDKLQANARHQQLAAQHRQYLDKLEAFTAPTAAVELTQGVLNAETIKALSEFLFEERKKLTETELQLATEQRELTEQTNLLTREREVLTGGSAKTIREAVVFVNLQGEGGNLRLRYLVNGASWTPSYNVRTGAERKNIVLEYNASIQQMSGEAWNDVKMALSTATPALAAKAPTLEALVIAVGEGQPVVPTDGLQGATAYKETKKSLAAQQRDLDRARISNFFAGKDDANQDAATTASGEAHQQADYDEKLNSLANELQVLDLISQARVTRAEPQQENEEGVSVSYALTSRTSIPSRSDRQLIQVAAMPMKADFYKVAIPVLTSYVYEEATVTNESKNVLLPGPFTTYVDGQFVGRGDLPLVAVGESFTTGFGIDSSLRTRRELVDKSETIQGGNRVVDFTYRLTVENFGSDTVNLRLVDRLPTAKGTDVKLTLVSSGPELSNDERYLQAERKRGILRWEVSVPAQAVGPKAYTSDYKLQMEYDKQLAITGLPIAQQ